MSGADSGKRGIEVEGLVPVLRSLNTLGKDINARVREQSMVIAAEEALRLQRAAAQSGDALSVAIGAAIRRRSDRLPTIVAGGSKRIQVTKQRTFTKFGTTKTGRVTRRQAKTKARKLPTAGQVFFGAEFGGGRKPTTKQFRPHQGRKGYWFWPQIREDEGRMLELWAKAVDQILSDTTGGSDG